jgi:predicted transposase/invertase (TIGR01784 family)
MKEIHLSERGRRLADALEKERWAQAAREQDRFEEGKAAGRTEGKAAGKAEGIRENAQQMKRAGISPEQISGITGLSGGEIENL